MIVPYLVSRSPQAFYELLEKEGVISHELSTNLENVSITGPGTSADELWDLGSREAIVEHLREQLKRGDKALHRAAAKTGCAILNSPVAARRGNLICCARERRSARSHA